MNLDQSFVNAVLSEGTDEAEQLIYKFGNFLELYENRKAVKLRNKYGLTPMWRIISNSSFSKSKESIDYVAFELLPELLNDIAPFNTQFSEHDEVKNKYGFWIIKNQSG